MRRGPPLPLPLLAIALALAGAPAVAPAQQLPAAVRAESLRAAGRPWHAAETLNVAAAREADPPVEFLVAGARAQLDARRWERARSLLVGQPWLSDDREGLSVLGEAEARLGMHLVAAERFSAARDRAAGAAAGLLAVRQGMALEAAGQFATAAVAYREARALGLAAIAGWLRVREARVTRDTAAATTLLTGLDGAARQAAPRARAAALLAAGDSAGAQRAFSELGQRQEAVMLALARSDTAAARTALYGSAVRPSDRDAAVIVAGLSSRVPPRAASEYAALARALQQTGDRVAARAAADRAVARGDSSPATLLLAGDLRAASGELWSAASAYQAAARDSAAAPLAAYRRARVLVRLGEAGALRALAGFADTYPADTAAPTAIYLVGDYLVDRGDWDGARRWWAELLTRYPADARASLARFRLALRAYRNGSRDSAAAYFQAERAAAGTQAAGAQYWLGRLAAEAGDSATARAHWTALAATDSLYGYYSWRARWAAGLPPPVIPADSVGAPALPEVTAALARLDTLALAGLDTEVVAEVRALLAAPPGDTDALLAWSTGLAARGFGPAAVRLGWLALARAPGDRRALRAVFPWPNRAAVEEEAAEFGVDPWLFVALVRQESTFDPEARSTAGARGLAQLLPATAAQTARGLDVTFSPDWITVPDLNLHLGAAHLSRLLARYPTRPDAAIAAYNAGSRPVSRWLERPGADDRDVFLEEIGYAETRAYLRAVLRNRWLYAALYPATP